MKGSRLEHLAPASGLLFASFAVAGVLLSASQDPGSSGAKILAHYASSGNRGREWGGIALLGLAALCLVWFAGSLRARLVEAERGSARLSTLAFAGGVLLAGLVLVGQVVHLSLLASISWADDFTLDPDTARIVLFIGDFATIGGAALGGAVMVGATTLLARRADAFPRFIAWIGYVLTPALILALPLYGIPALALLLWVAATSLLMLREDERPDKAALPVHRSM